MEHDPIKAGEFEFGGPEPSASRFAHQAAKGRFGRRRHTALARDRRAGDDAGHQAERVLGGQGIGAGRGMLEEIVGAHGAAAQVGSVKTLLGFFDLCATCRQIDVEYFAIVAKRHLGPLLVSFQ